MLVQKHLLRRLMTTRQNELDVLDGQAMMTLFSAR
jgi:hypothetical protein